jgi:hypothetical protein
LIRVSSVGEIATRGGAFAGKSAEIDGDEIDVGMKLTCVVSKSIRGFHYVNPDGQ